MQALGKIIKNAWKSLLSFLHHLSFLIFCGVLLLKPHDVNTLPKLLAQTAP